jgi:hypothetical protein
MTNVAGTLTLVEPPPGPEPVVAPAVLCPRVVPVPAAAVALAVALAVVVAPAGVVAVAAPVDVAEEAVALGVVACLEPPQPPSSRTAGNRAGTHLRRLTVAA